MVDQKLERSNSRIQKINTRVTTATARRVVQLMPRLTHQSSAQLITTGTMISSCNATSPVALTPAAGATGPDADSTADLHTGLGAVDFDKTGTKRRAGIAASCALQREPPA